MTPITRPKSPFSFFSTGLLLAVGLIAAGQTASPPRAPIRQSAADRRLFEWAGNAHLQLLGCWGATPQKNGQSGSVLSREEIDYRAWVDALLENGCNFTRLYLLERNAEALASWPRGKNGRLGPAFWSRLAAILAHAEHQGLIIELVLFRAGHPEPGTLRVYEPYLRQVSELVKPYVNVLLQISDGNWEGTGGQGWAMDYLREVGCDKLFAVSPLGVQADGIARLEQAPVLHFPGISDPAQIEKLAAKYRGLGKVLIFDSQGVSDSEKEANADRTFAAAQKALEMGHHFCHESQGSEDFLRRLKHLRGLALPAASPNALLQTPRATGKSPLQSLSSVSVGAHYYAPELFPLRSLRLCGESY